MGEWRHLRTLSDLVLNGGELCAPAALTPQKTLGTDFTEGWALPQNRSGRSREPLPGNRYQFAGCAVSTVDRQSTD